MLAVPAAAAGAGASSPWVTALTSFGSQLAQRAMTAGDDEGGGYGTIGAPMPFSTSGDARVSIPGGSIYFGDAGAGSTASRAMDMVVALAQGAIVAAGVIGAIRALAAIKG